MIARSVFLTIAAAAFAWAQMPEGGAPFHLSVPPTGQAMGPDVVYMRTEVAGSGEVVKGAPFSAETVTEFTQTLADGNVIRRKQTGSMYRDSEGRTRREQSLGPVGPLPMPAKAVQLVFINDPIAGVSYVLDGNRKTAQKLPLPKWGDAAGFAAGAAGASTVDFGPGPGTRVIQRLRAEPAGQQGETETRTIEGVQAVGNRTTHTIPAGEIGNDRAIETVSERWYSPELQTVVMSKQVDPRMGETTYRLTNINRAEPAHSLFEVPADYALTEGPPGDVKFMIRKRVETKEIK